ncbi:MAG: helix-turn-helix domain-containing protein [Lachnospiraceae bacterium]|nr:helix-turn-helix domain-containing protein [Lachnospiraceae bacterium]
MEKKYYTVKDIRDIFGCGQSKAYKMLKEGIPHIRIGRNIYIPIKEFEKWQKDKINL